MGWAHWNKFSIPTLNRWCKMIVLYCSLVFACVWLGVSQAKRLSARHKFYVDMMAFLKSYEENLSFRQDNFKDLANRLLTNEENDFNLYLASVVSNQEVKKLDYLSEKEIRYATSIINGLGKTDQETDEQTTKHYQFMVEELIKKTKEAKEKYSGLSIKISFLIGLLLVILLL